jgi:hypothetical protein
VKNQFKVGDLVKHTTILGKLNRGYGIVIEILPLNNTTIDTIRCFWSNGKKSWIHKGQIKLIARGQSGKSS